MPQSAQNSYFDESLFVDGLAVKNYDIVGVSNRADEFLVEKHGKRATPVHVGCRAAVNPTSPCAGVNVFTMSRKHRVVHRVYNFGKIRVAGDAKHVVPITIADPVPDVVYDFNKNLTPVEMAVMLKYYSMSSANRRDVAGDDDDTQTVRISSHLYHTVFEFFDDSDYSPGGSIRNARNWLDDILNNSLVRLPSREIVYRNQIVNVPDLTFFGPQADIH